MRLNILLLFVFLTSVANSQNMYLFIGTYTNTGSKGIYVYRFNVKTGKAEPVSNTEGVVNPSYLAVSPGGQNVYAVNETNGEQPGQVSAFGFDKAKGELTFINQQLSGGDDPCYLSVNKANNWLFVANYSGGSVSALAINNDGSLNAAAQVIQHTGTSINKGRQEKAHVHSAVLSPAQDYLFTADLGMDQIAAYKFSPRQTRPLQETTIEPVSVKPGNGPRHLVFHPNGKWAYLSEEMSGTVGVYKYANGKLTLVQSIAAHPADFTGQPGSADIHVSPDGKFVYASNRGKENNLAIFSINPTIGKLTLKGIQPAIGKTPRNFAIDPTGQYLLIANQDSDNIVVFKRNKVTGMLKETGEQIKLPKPVCLQFLQ
jgi:6-phosphogluconolactonase